MKGIDIVKVLRILGLTGKGTRVTPIFRKPMKDVTEMDEVELYHYKGAIKYGILVSVLLLMVIVGVGRITINYIEELKVSNAHYRQVRVDVADLVADYKIQYGVYPVEEGALTQTTIQALKQAGCEVEQAGCEVELDKTGEETYYVLNKTEVYKGLNSIVVRDYTKTLETGTYNILLVDTKGILYIVRTWDRYTKLKE